MDKKIRVCIYGTLRKGRKNNAVLMNPLNGQAEYVCDAITKDKYPLILGPTKAIPYLLDAKGKGKNVEVEVYDVDEKMKLFLDGMEFVGKWYDISEIELIRENGEEFKAIGYVLKNFKEKFLQFPCYETYSKDLDKRGYTEDAKVPNIIDDIIKEMKI